MEGIIDRMCFRVLCSQRSVKCLFACRQLLKSLRLDSCPVLIKCRLFLNRLHLKDVNGDIKVDNLIWHNCYLPIGRLIPYNSQLLTSSVPFSPISMYISLTVLFSEKTRCLLNKVRAMAYSISCISVCSRSPFGFAGRNLVVDGVFFYFHILFCNLGIYYSELIIL